MTPACSRVNAKTWGDANAPGESVYDACNQAVAIT